ncbi:MAG: carbon starvation protein A [Phycisphaerales bacterium]|jgi:carbon starvation protein|nr:carbon starvation protein A [Phycisphaerales bacterium]
METLIIALAAGFGFILAYHTYGKWLGKKVFRLSASAVCPSTELRDDVDFVPTPRSIIFGHHFTSIAGTGPIVGPAIAVMWGWLPALLWVVFGAIFIGAVHDFGSLVVSLRNKGQSVGDVAGHLISPRTRMLFLLVLFLGLTVVLAIFGLVIAAVFRMYPSAIFPCIVQVPIAVIIGTWLHRKGVGILIPSLLALCVIYLTVIFGNDGMLGSFNSTLATLPTIAWVVILLAYSYFASVLPVWSLLQPRDYINALQLLSVIALIVVGLIVAAFVGGAPINGTRPELLISAPMIDIDPADAPLIFPFLFITIACGACSGFHCLVASGTSSKQVSCETDAKFVGYGSMLTEGFLATLVILACVAGLSLGIDSEQGTLLGSEAWNARYASWATAGGLGAKVGAFVDGSANFIASMGISPSVAVAFMGVFVASFAGTTLDTACRLQRYVIQEIAKTPSLPLKGLSNKHTATTVAVMLALVLAAIPASGEWSFTSMGTGGLILWPLFGAINQLLAGLAFLVIAAFLWHQKKPIWFIVLPAIFMLVMPMWAMVMQALVGTNAAQSWLAQERWLLLAMGIAAIVLEIWILFEALALIKKDPRQRRGSLES